jgi:AcrR family transcriptional regulator
VVVGLLEARGYDGWWLRDVAELAHASLATVYKYFPSRQELIAAAVERWMDANIFRAIPRRPHDQSVFDASSHMFRAIPTPWEKHPRLLEVYVQAGATKGRDRLLAQGGIAAERLGPIGDLDPECAADVEMLRTNASKVLSRATSNWEVAVTDILPILERTVLRLQQAPVTMDAPRRGSHPAQCRGRGRR